MSDQDWQYTRWWRVLDPNGRIWCETSDEKEARSAMRPDDRLERLYRRAAFDYVWKAEE